MKYITVKTGSLIQQVAKPISEGYTEGVIECFLPDDTKMTTKQIHQWIRENNKRMKAICKFLNDNNL